VGIFKSLKKAWASSIKRWRSLKNLIGLKSVGFGKLVEYDEKCFGGYRRGFVRPRRASYEGYGFLRKSQVGSKVVLFVARDKSSAQKVLDYFKALSNEGNYFWKIINP